MMAIMANCCLFIHMNINEFALLQKHVILNRKSNQEGPHLDKHQKTILSIWTN
jgi:hypothetical protein